MTKNVKEKRPSRVGITGGSIALIAIFVYFIAPFVGATVNILLAIGVGVIMAVAVMIAAVIESSIDDYIRWGPVGELIAIIIVGLIMVSVVMDSIVSFTPAMKILLLFITYSSSQISKITSKLLGF